MKLQELFPLARFNNPAKNETLLHVEKELGIEIPRLIRSRFLECDGFRENLGNAKYLLSLTDEDTIGSCLSVNRFMWSDETMPNLSPYFFFGFSSGDDAWGIEIEEPNRIIAYHHSMGDTVEELGYDILEIYRNDFSLYND